jgi:hypothetical protein
METNKEVISQGGYTIVHWEETNIKTCFIECYDANGLIFKSAHSKNRHIQTLRKVNLTYTSDTSEFNRMFKAEIRDYQR